MRTTESSLADYYEKKDTFDNEEYDMYRMSKLKEQKEMPKDMKAKI